MHIISRDGVEKAVGITATVLRTNGEIVGAVEFFHDLGLFDHVRQQQAATGIVTGSPAMNRIIDMLPNIAKSDCSVLVLGPSGSGKELIAQAIHSLSPRRFGPYVRINCAALPASLLESELFGFVKGAFTDARHDKPGHFTLANGGTLLLDEISEMDVSLQVKLLRVLNNGEYQPLGSTRTLHTDARVIAATNADLKAAIEQKRFRSDLYFRINVVTIEIPPLCQRKEEIPLLVTHFIDKYAAITGKGIRGITTGAMRLLIAYDYPGNVRELENAIEHAFVMCDGELIQPECLPSHLAEATLPRGRPARSRRGPRAAAHRAGARSTAGQSHVGRPGSRDAPHDAMAEDEAGRNRRVRVESCAATAAIQCRDRAGLRGANRITSRDRDGCQSLISTGRLSSPRTGFPAPSRMTRSGELPQ